MTEKREAAPIMKWGNGMGGKISSHLLFIKWPIIQISMKQKVLYENRRKTKKKFSGEANRQV